MYGTIGRMKPKAGQRDALIGMMSAPPSGAAADGYRGSYLLKAEEGDELVVAVMYEDKDAYFAMVHDPQTDENFGRNRSYAGPTHSPSVQEGSPSRSSMIRRTLPRGVRLNVRSTTSSGGEERGGGTQELRRRRLDRRRRRRAVRRVQPGDR